MSRDLFLTGVSAPPSILSARPVKATDPEEAAASRINEVALNKIPVDEDVLQGAMASKTFPHLAWEMIQAGLFYERKQVEALEGHCKMAEEIQEQIDLLLDLNKELSKLPHDLDEYQLSAEALEVLKKLEQNGIHLLEITGEGKFSKEKLFELKSANASRREKLSTEHSTILSTKIQPNIHAMSQVYKAMEIIASSNRQLGKTLTDNQRSR